MNILWEAEPQISVAAYFCTFYFNDSATFYPDILSLLGIIIIYIIYHSMYNL